ncbi:MAG: OPT/YSL family transporter [Planctomycetes bacterium]|nr:OPT/YSL family transporter [Planctomycetota bacterium]
MSDRYPFPAAEVWRSVAEALTRGLGGLPASAVWAACIGSAAGIVLEVGRKKWPRISLSPIGIGLAFVIPFDASFAMFAGAFAFWIGAKVWRKPSSWYGSIVQPNHESICSGLIAGAALMGLVALGVEAAFG